MVDSFKPSLRYTLSWESLQLITRLRWFSRLSLLTSLNIWCTEWGCSLLSALCNVCLNDRGSRWQQKSLTNTGKKSSVNKQWHPAEWSGLCHSYVCADMLVKVQYVRKNIKNSYIMQLRRQQLQLAWRRGYSADIPPPMCSNSTGITPLDNSPSGQWVRVLLFHPFLGARGRLSPPEQKKKSSYCCSPAKCLK